GGLNRRDKSPDLLVKARGMRAETLHFVFQGGVECHATEKVVETDAEVPCEQSGEQEVVDLLSFLSLSNRGGVYQQTVKQLRNDLDYSPNAQGREIIERHILERGVNGAEHGHQVHARTVQRPSLLRDSNRR